jgi:hypothetical protein
MPVKHRPNTRLDGEEKIKTKLLDQEHRAIFERDCLFVIGWLRGQWAERVCPQSQTPHKIAI